jgi:hypothetical protein
MKRTVLAAVPALTLFAAACGGGSESNKKAYEACVAWAKKQEKYAAAELAPLDKSQIAGMQDSSIAVVIPAKVAGADAKIECSVIKNQDDTMSVQSGN